MSQTALQTLRIKAYPVAFTLLSVGSGAKIVKGAKETLKERRETFSEAEEMESLMSELRSMSLSTDSLLAVCLTLWRDLAFII